MKGYLSNLELTFRIVAFYKHLLAKPNVSSVLLPIGMCDLHVCVLLLFCLARMSFRYKSKHINDDDNSAKMTVKLQCVYCIRVTSVGRGLRPRRLSICVR